MDSSSATTFSTNLKTIASSKLLIIFAVGLLARLSLAPFTGNPWDMYVWIQSGRDFLEHQINPYDVLYYKSISTGRYFAWYGYPPVWFFSIIQSYFLYTLLPWQKLELAYLAIKAPLIATDLLVGYIIYTQVRSKIGHKAALIATSAYILNPYVIWISAGWGIHDNFCAIFTLIAYIAYVNGHPKTSATSLGLAIASKQYSIFALPAFLLLKPKTSSRLTYLVITALVPLAVSLPFLVWNYRSYLFMLEFQAFRNPRGVTYWGAPWLLHGLHLYELEEYFIAFSWISIPLTLAAYGLIVFRALHNQSGTTNFLSVLLSCCLVYFLFARNINTPFLVWICPLIVISAALQRTSWELWVYALLSSLFMLYLAVYEPLPEFWGIMFPTAYYRNVQLRAFTLGIGIAAVIVELFYFIKLLRRF
ncbi:hypothetical protein KEJ26_07450 [Candidatus Bathyarchaeota archaeon]|nr:hypothetical protein [Candidatus Bathyarchaeota archaeon]